MRFVFFEGCWLRVVSFFRFVFWKNCEGCFSLVFPELMWACFFRLGFPGLFFGVAFCFVFWVVFGVSDRGRGVVFSFFSAGCVFRVVGIATRSIWPDIATQSIWPRLVHGFAVRSFEVQHSGVARDLT